MRRLLFSLAILLAAGTALADNQFYVNDFTISSNDLGSTITVPVRATFDARVSAFLVDVNYPEGVTGYQAVAGSDMTLPYLDMNGNQSTYPVALNKNDDLTRFVGVVIDGGYWYPEGSNDLQCYGVIKWEAGQYDEMFLLTVAIDENFTGGAITLETQLSSGEDARGGIVPEVWGITTVCNITVVEEPKELTGTLLLADLDEDRGMVYVCYDGPEDVEVTVLLNGEVVVVNNNRLLLPDYGTWTVQVTVEAAGYLPLEASRTYEWYPPEVTEAPNISYTIDDMFVTISAVGSGEVHMYIDGEEVENPITVNRTYEDIEVVVTATAQEPGKEMSETACMVVLVPALEKMGVPAPVIETALTDTEVIVTIIWPESDGIQYYNGEYHYTRTNETVVYEVEAYVGEGSIYRESDHIYMAITVPALDTPALDDYMFVMDDYTILRGNTVTIPVTMINAHPVTAFQTDLYVPEGFELVGVELGDRKRDHSLLSNNRADGGVRLLCYSPSLSAFSGNDGVLFTLTVKVPADVEGGDYELLLKKILLTTTTYEEVSCANATSTLNVLAYMPGDVNGDGRVTVTDVVVAAQYVLGLNPDPFVFEAADMTGDGEITVTDVVLIARIVLNPQELNNPLRAPGRMDNDDAMSGEDITLQPGETRTVSIALDNDIEYTAFQFDLQLPAGLTATNYRLTDRAGSHTLQSNELDGNEQRVMCYSPQLAAIAGNEGAVLSFDVTATGSVASDIIVSGIEMVSTDFHTVYLDNFTIGVNDALSKVNEIASAVRIYSDGHNIIVETPVSQTVVISDVAGRMQRVDVPAGRTEIPSSASGVVIVSAGEKSAKLLIQ